ncbi:MAG: PilZ domain-containing protein [Terracidiphilus sp.]
MESRKLCAYNQTRECFLGLEVDGADLSLAKLKDRIATLALKSGEGLWLSPFRGLPEWGIRVPLDLLYLDQDCRVIDVVESYPVFRANAGTAQPVSVLALPTHSIYSSQTQSGDQLVLCVAEEMQQRLERFTGTANHAAQGAAAGTENGNRPGPVPVPVVAAPKRAVAAVPLPAPPAPKHGAASVVQSAVLLREKPLWSGGPGLLELENRSEEEPSATRQTHMMGLIQPEMKDVRPPRGWLERWWSPDPRKAPREAAPGLAAYYWTGGPPQAHTVKDISSSGLYVVTEERWYPGTLVLMTLQNSEAGEEVKERTICVHSRAVRWGKDGVGLQFVLQDESGDATMAAADRKALDRFLARLRKGKQ